MKKLLECVPNFSEGRNMETIEQITSVIENVEGVRLLDVDPGKATNRTVGTFAGDPDSVVEAAFLAARKASQLIDMSKHKGEHPRFGAVDVCPLVPLRGISMEETVEYARKLGERIGRELSIPVYCYEYAAFREGRKNLADVRSGEYEGLADKLHDPEWKPDFGPAVFNKRSGAVAVGARNFLVAYNVNLNTTSTRRANAIAFDVREKGRAVKSGDPVKGAVVRDERGEPVYVPGTLKSVKAIGWYIKEYGIAQVSMNLTDINITPVHVAFEEVSRKAADRGIRVTGSEIVGMVPLRIMIEAGKYFLKKQKRSAGVSDKELIRIAVRSLGLDDLDPFNPNDKIIEYKLAEGMPEGLAGMSLRDLMNEVASESPAPGGGSVSAIMGSLGIALGTMVANLSAHKRGWDDRWLEFSDWAEKGKILQEELLRLADEDTAAFDSLMKCFELPKGTEEEKKIRARAIGDATLHAMEVPFRVMQSAYKGFEILQAMAEKGNPASVSDAGVGAVAIRSCIMGAWLNVRINAAGIINRDPVKDILAEAEKLVSSSGEKEKQILGIVQGKITDN